MADIFCSTDIEDFVPLECGIERAGIRAIGLIDLTEEPSDANLEDASFWTTKLATSPAKYWLIKPTRGEYNGGTPTEEDGFGMESTQVTGADHEATIEFEGLDANRDFVESINRRKFKLVLFTAAGLMLYIEAPVTIYTKITNPRSIKAGAFWAMIAKWQSYDNPKVLTTPDILD